MLTQEQIRNALHASRVVPLDVKYPHGPLGLEHLAAALARRMGKSDIEPRVRRSIDLPPATWEKLDRLAAETSRTTSRSVRASELAATIIEEYLMSAGR